MKKLFASHSFQLACMALASLAAVLCGHADAALLSVGMAGLIAPGRGTVFQDNNVISTMNSETLRQTLYDYLLYPAAGRASLIFFSQGIGSGVTSDPSGTVGGLKTIYDTNMQQGGALSSGLAYNIETVSVYFFPGSVNTANTFTPVLFGTATTDALSATTVNALNDIKSFYEAGLLQFNVLQKQYLQETPLRKFPPQTNMRLEGALAAADTNATTAVKLQTINAYPTGRAYVLTPEEISLQPAVTFNVALSWSAAYALPSGFNGRVGVEFDGVMLRAAQ